MSAPITLYDIEQKLIALAKRKDDVYSRQIAEVLMMVIHYADQMVGVGHEDQN